jgi:hypothetical protein
MELKYKVADVEKMIDVFSTLSKEYDTDESAKLMEQALETLSDYPVDVVEEFVKCINDLESKNIIVTKDEYQGVLGYIMIRLNLK